MVALSITQQMQTCALRNGGILPLTQEYNGGTTDSKFRLLKNSGFYLSQIKKDRIKSDNDIRRFYLY
jgi:hypothetical protein